MSTRLEQRRIALIASTTLVYPFHAPGTLFTNRGATGAVTATLPTPNDALRGAWYEFRVHANQSLIVAAAAANTLVAPGDIAADNVGFQIGSKKIGRGLIVKCDGTQWFATPQSADGFCVDGTEAVPSFGSGAALVAPAISGAATIASGATIVTATQTFTTTGVTATGATGGSGAVLPTQTPAFVTVTGATGSGVDLPTGPVGASYFVKNLFAGTMRFYCVGGTIDGTTGTTAALITTTGNKSAWFFNTSASGAWIMAGNT